MKNRKNAGKIIGAIAKQYGGGKNPDALEAALAGAKGLF